MLTLTRKVGESICVYERATMRLICKITLNTAQDNWARIDFEADRKVTEILRTELVGKPPEEK